MTYLEDDAMGTGDPLTTLNHEISGGGKPPAPQVKMAGDG